ncbi:TadE/TadG family type IV pilus assembly protein [Lentzea nigeriaca]|uniref:TadE/TadG family type IV pilus assembly protein n=1 Tax=Lentzea nigeriaca TaxID=1128665 RepID=UPI00195943A3|nr:TadE/TadG family type IV pilus assembly protein [Lentzea nigeriaca]MBM7859138.1 Flp pilus assembly protein TadG [Lentzea nigeriaca]
MKPPLGADYHGSAPASNRDRGAAAVEFALVLPVLLLVMCGIIDFGRALHAQVVLTQAAREGARLAALGEPDTVSRTRDAAGSLTAVEVDVTACPANLAAADAVVTVTHDFTFATPIDAIAGTFGGDIGPITLSGKGVMRCQG